MRAGFRDQHEIFPVMKFVKIILILGSTNTNFFGIFSLERLEHMLASVWVMYKWISLRPVDELEMLCAWLTEYRLARHGGSASAKWVWLHNHGYGVLTPTTISVTFSAFLLRYLLFLAYNTGHSGLQGHLS